jgi:steroid delta-isomerase-like uncharacterized protein
MSTEHNKALIHQFFIQAEQRNFAAIMDLLAPNFVAHLGGATSPLDRATFRQATETFHAAFANERLIIEDQVAEGERVATWWICTATHTGELQDLPPTGRPVRFTGINLDRIVNDRIAEHRTMFDQMGLLQQLGMMPDRSIGDSAD